jgi:hypothetical protein
MVGLLSVLLSKGVTLSSVVPRKTLQVYFMNKWVTEWMDETWMVG